MPPLPLSLAATPPKPSEATNTKPEATKAKPESHRAQEHANASRMDHSDAALTMKLQQAQVCKIGQHSNDSDTSSNTKHSMCDNSHGTSSTSSSICSCSHVYDPGGSKFSNDNTGDGPRCSNDDANTDKSIVQLTEVNTDPTITPSPSSLLMFAPTTPIVGVPATPFLVLSATSSPLPCSTMPAAHSTSPTTTHHLPLDNHTTNCISHCYSDNDDNTDNTCKISIGSDITGSDTSSTNTSSINGSSSNHYCVGSPCGERDNNNVKGTSTHNDGNSTSSIRSPLTDCAAHSFSNSNIVYNPRGDTFSSDSIVTSSLGSNTLTYNCGGLSNNSNNSGFVHDPGSTSFSSTLDTSNAATTSDHGNHAFDPGSAPFNSSLPSLCAQHTSSTDGSSKHNNSSRSHKSKHSKSMHDLTNSLSNNSANSEPNARSFGVDSFVYDPSGSRFSSNRSSLPTLCV
jgi:hypothetical protein